MSVTVTFTMSRETREQELALVAEQAGQIRQLRRLNRLLEVANHEQFLLLQSTGRKAAQTWHWYEQSRERRLELAVEIRSLREDNARLRAMLLRRPDSETRILAAARREIDEAAMMSAPGAESEVSRGN